MRCNITWISVLAVFFLSVSCKKGDKINNCFSDVPTIRQINNRKAVVRLTATYTEPVYLVEEGTIDTRLIPCNFPLEFYQNDLQVTISGKVKVTKQTGQVPCCAENFVITSISR